MNLADAIRNAALSAKPAPDERREVAPPVEHRTLVPDAPVPMPENTEELHSSTSTVRLELTLTADQMNVLLRALMDGHHSVLTMREAATHLRLTSSTLERLAESGEIPAMRIDGRWRFPKIALDEWLLAQTYKHERENRDVA